MRARRKWQPADIVSICTGSHTGSLKLSSGFDRESTAIENGLTRDTCPLALQNLKNLLQQPDDRLTLAGRSQEREGRAIGG